MLLLKGHLGKQILGKAEGPRLENRQEERRLDCSQDHSQKGARNEASIIAATHS
jgi:hypothetical protein